MSSDIHPVSTRLLAIKPSASAWVSQAAKKLKSEGHDVIDMGLGEPDFDTPAHIIEAAHSAAQQGQTRYPPTGGTRELKQAVVEKLRRDNQLDYAPSEVIISNGAKQVIFNALMASLEPENEVLLCAPYFGQYEDMVRILGGKPVAVPCHARDKFLASPEIIENAITSNTRWLILNAPSNPTGAIYSKEQLESIGEVLKRHPQVMVMADEIYEHIIFDNQLFVSFAQACPDLRARTLIVNGVSKAYAMTGWRIGYGAGNQTLIDAMVTVQSQISSGACSVAQAAAAAALNGPQDSVYEFRKAFERRRNLVENRIRDIQGLTLDAPSGAFYAFVGCEQFIGAAMPCGAIIQDDAQFTEYLLSDAKVAAVPGSAYGLSPYFRLSTALSDDILDEAISRIAESVAKLVPPQKTQCAN